MSGTNLSFTRSPKFDVDNIKITDRLKNVDNFILTNYDSFYNKDGYKILKKDKS